MHVKRSLALLLGAAGASVSAGAGFLYLGDEHPPIEAPANARVARTRRKSDRSHTGGSLRRPLRAISKKDLGLEQSMARDVACWISSATVYAATQAFYAARGGRTPQLQLVDHHPHPLADLGTSLGTTTIHSPSASQGSAFPSLAKLTASDEWDAAKIVQSSSFNMLLNLVSGVGTMSLREDFELELYQAIGHLATNAQCAEVIVERTTRYGKHALLNLSRAHELDPRMGQALVRMVHGDTVSGVRFGPANLISLMALAVAEEIPDEYMEFALWALGKAASQASLTTTYEWRKSLFGNDVVTKTRAKLIVSERLWNALDTVTGRSDGVQLQAARLIREMTEEPTAVKALKRHLGCLQLVKEWIDSSNPVIACMALGIVSNVAHDAGIRSHLLAMDLVDVVRARLLTKNDDKLNASLLKAVRHLALPKKMAGEYVLDKGSLSFVRDSDEDHPLLHDDLVHPDAVLRHQYIDGWIELFTTLLRSSNEDVRTEATLCLEQLATHGKHHNQGIQEWLIAVLDGVLQQVPPSISASSTTVRAAKSRTRPIAGRKVESSEEYSISHAKALKALAFVTGRKECQDQFVRLGGIQLLKRLLQSEDVNVQRESARLLANLFTCDNLNAAVAEFARSDENLTEVLELWTRSSDVMLQTLAHRARSNRRYQHNRLQNADDSDVKYLDGVHPFHFSTSPAFNADKQSSSSDSDEATDYDVDVVFIHGLLGCPHETWTCGEDESAVWAQEWLLDDLKQEGHNPRILSIGYDTQLLASESVWRTMDFKETSQEVLKKLRAARIGDRPVVFVTHSLGGVLVKQVLLESTSLTGNPDGPKSKPLIDNLTGVIFFGVPHRGSPIAQTVQAFRPRSLGIQQHPVTEHLHGTPHLEMLNSWCSQAFSEKNIPAISIGETIPCKIPVVGVEALVVPPMSANPGFGDFVLVADSTHVDICKPRSRDDVRYTVTKEFITKHLPQAGMMDVE